MLQAARKTGERNVLDTLDYVSKQKRRLKRLHQDDGDGPVETSASLAGFGQRPTNSGAKKSTKRCPCDTYHQDAPRFYFGPQFSGTLIFAAPVTA